MASPSSDTSSETEKGTVRLRSTWGSLAAGFRGVPTLSAVEGTPRRNPGPHSAPRRGSSAISSCQRGDLRSARLSPARWIRGPAWMLRLRAPSEDGPAATRLKTSRGYQVRPEPSRPDSAPSWRLKKPS